MGRWHDEPVGPHVQAMYQIAFQPELFPTLVPFLMMNRMGLTVLLHPQSGRPRDDHTLNAMWMGEVLPVKTEVCGSRTAQVVMPARRPDAGRRAVTRPPIRLTSLPRLHHPVIGGDVHVRTRSLLERL